jgi:hypothetical protein
MELRHLPPCLQHSKTSNCLLLNFNKTCILSLAKFSQKTFREHTQEGYKIGAGNSERSKIRERQRGACPVPLSWSAHRIFAGERDLGTSLLLCSKKMSSQEN